jgi:hypothetical protein
MACRAAASQSAHRSPCRCDTSTVSVRARKTAAVAPASQGSAHVHISREEPHADVSAGRSGEHERDNGQNRERGGEAIDHNPITSYRLFGSPLGIRRRRLHRCLVNRTQKAPVQDSARSVSVDSLRPWSVKLEHPELGQCSEMSPEWLPRQARAYHPSVVRIAVIGACAMVAAGLIVGAATSDSREVVPRFSLSSTAATTNDSLAVRVERALRQPQREIRLYLVPIGIRESLRSRFDSRLSFIGSVRSSHGARMRFTMPPLEPGTYSLAYWCRNCLPRAEGVSVQAGSTLRVSAPTGGGCASTLPNGNPPTRETSPIAFRFHGNGQLSAFLRTDGTLVTNALGGYKMRWRAKEGGSAPFTVRYRLLDPPSAPLTARTGTFGGSYGPASTMSQMGFTAGCWQITGRLRDVNLGFVTKVVIGSH